MMLYQQLDNARVQAAQNDRRQYGQDVYYLAGQPEEDDSFYVVAVDWNGKEPKCWRRWLRNVKKLTSPPVLVSYVSKNMAITPGIWTSALFLAQLALDDEATAVAIYSMKELDRFGKVSNESLATD